MVEHELSATGPRVPGRVPGRVRSGVARVFKPLWSTTFRDPIRDGRLRLRGLSTAERLVARVGLVTLAVVLGSALFADAWRRGELVPMDAGGSRQFVPASILGITLVGFAAAWLVITWGGLRGSALVRALTALAYLLGTADFAVDFTVAAGSDAWIVQHHRLVQEVGWYAPAAALLIAAVTVRWPRLDRWVLRIARVVCTGGIAALFLGLLWIHAELIREGRETLTASLIGGSLVQIGLLLLPLVYLSSVAVVDFALDVSTSLAAPAASARRSLALVLVLGLVAVKLWFEVVAKADYWHAALAHQPQAIVRTAICTVLLGVLAYVVTRFRHSEDSLAAKEDLTLGSSLVLTAPFLGKIIVLMAAIAVISQNGNGRVLGWTDHFPATWLNTWGVFILSMLAVAVGIVLMRRSRGGLGDELGSGLILIGAWGTVAGAVTNFGFTFGFSYPTVDVTVTLGVLLVVLARWRSADTGLLVTAATVLVFTWLVTSRGDYISFAGGLVGLSGVVVFVFGIVWTLLSGSSFTSSSSRLLPQPARPLLFIGYVLLSVVILCWDETTHTATSGSDALSAYYFLGIPLAAWLLGRRVITRPEPATQPPSSAGRS
jgi:hypothetical protein